MLVFAAVAKKGSFTQAAKYLGVSKSAVSQQISVLESELGVSLINRTTRGIFLTAVGKLIYYRCDSLQDQIDSLLEDIDDALKNPRGRFTVTFPHSLEHLVILPAIEKLCQEFPGLQPKLIASDQTLDLVEHSIGLAIHAGELPDSSYRALPIGIMTEIFCASPSYLEKHPAPKTVAELEQHSWIATDWQKRRMPVTCTQSLTTETASLNQYASVNTLPTAVGMALRHMGIVLLPSLAVKELINQGELVPLLDHIEGPSWPVYALHAYQNKKPVYVTRFHQLVSRFFENA